MPQPANPDTQKKRHYRRTAAAEGWKTGRLAETAREAGSRGQPLLETGS